MQVVKEGYKVVHPVDHLHVRSAMNPTRYRLHKWQQPQQGWGPIAIFKTYKAASYFARCFLVGGKHVRHCFYVPSKQTCQWNAAHESLAWKTWDEVVLADAVYITNEV